MARCKDTAFIRLWLSSESGRLRSCSGRPGVPMMKTADATQGQRSGRFGRAWLNRPARRCRLLQAEVGSVCVVVGDVFTPKSPKVLIVQRDDVIEHFAANTTDPPLRHSILPRAPNTGANRFDGTGLQKFDNVAAELGVTVEQH